MPYLVMSDKMQPTIFIGSSKEGLDIAKIIESNLKQIGKVTLWTGIFDLNKSNFDNLVSQLAFFDYAILIATSDDVTVSRNKKSMSPRDNVIFEYGLFTGGIGASKSFLVIEEGAKLPSDLFGITLPYISKNGGVDFHDRLRTQTDSIISHIQSKEETCNLGYLPSTALAYGYFSNFIERTVERLLEDKFEKKQFFLQDGSSFTIEEVRVTVLIPNDLSDDMFNKVSAKRLRDGWQKMKVEPKNIRDYDFSIDISQVEHRHLHLVDIPLTLNALNKAIELYSKKEHIGKSIKENLLEYREIRSFTKTLEYLVRKSSLTKGIVEIEVVDI